MLATSDLTGAELAFDIGVWLVVILGLTAGVVRVLRRRWLRRCVRVDGDGEVVPVRSPSPHEEQVGAVHASPANQPDGLSAASGERPLSGERHLSGVIANSPALSGPRFAPAVLEPLGRYCDHSRRLAVTEAKVDMVLATLPRESWMVERYVLRAGRRIPFLVLGETGIYAIWTIPGPPPWHEPALLAGVGARVKELIPAYPGPVRVGICRALARDVKPRVLHLADAPEGVWIMGLGSLIPWLEHFGPEHGLGVADIAQFRRMAGPHWGRPTHPGAPLGIPAFE